MVTNCQAMLTDAYALVRTEHRQLTAESDAFERFGRRVQALALDCQTPDRDPTSLRTGRLTARPAESTRISEVQQAYRQTVLAVDHWETVYGESTVEESLSAEFSVPLASLLLRPGSLGFTAVVRARLLEESKQSSEMRRRTRALLETELDELRRLRRALPCIAELIDSVRDSDEPFEERVDRIRRARTALERLLDTHQTYLHSQPAERYEPLVTAVYADLEVRRYPGLSTIACLLTQLRNLELGLWAR